MTTLVDSIASILGSYNGTNTGYDIPYIIAGACLILGLWFCFKVVLLILHALTGGK